MRPDLHIAMRQALALGPDHCPPDLFAGAIPAIVSGLKAHNATIFQARYAALAATFPRTRALLGVTSFDVEAVRYLEQAHVLQLQLDMIGSEFPDLIGGTAGLLARIEWAWLEAYRAPEAAALRLSDLAGLDEREIVAIEVAVHPAVRLIESDQTIEVAFDGGKIRSPLVLITRPDADVQVAGTPSVARDLLFSRDSPRSLGELLERDKDTTAFLVEMGALSRATGSAR